MAFKFVNAYSYRMTDSIDFIASRLFPVTKGSVDKDRETNSTSVLLAAMQGVPEFGRSITQRLGAPSGRVETFVEVTFDSLEGKIRPDGLIRITRGKTSWNALIEVKTGRTKLDTEQVDKYHDLAAANNIDAVVTVSSQVVPAWGYLPTPVNKKCSKKVNRFHMSWSMIHTEAILLDLNHSVKDPTKAWILAEFLRYVEEKNSGPLDFHDLGDSWEDVNKSAIASTLRPQDAVTLQAASSYLSLSRYLAMKLSRDLGVVVQQVLTKKDKADIPGLINSMARELATTGKLQAAISIPNAASAVYITSDLRAQVITCSAVIDAPMAEHAKTRANWLLRQLKDSPRELQIKVNGSKSKETGPVVTLEQALKHPEILVKNVDFEIKSFTLTLLTKTNFKRSVFIDNAVKAVNHFYENVVQNLRIWIPPAPKVQIEIPEVPQDDTVTTSLNDVMELDESIFQDSDDVQSEIVVSQIDMDETEVQIMESIGKQLGSTQISLRD